MDNKNNEEKPEAAITSEQDSTESQRSDLGSRSHDVKPALQKHYKGKKDKHLKWDEQVIEEHDALRGTRMKIDEPNTPYTHYDSGAESDDSRRAKSPANQKPTLSWDKLERRLDSVAAVQDQFGYSPSSSHAESDMEDVEEERKKEMRRLEFKEHRKRHYNEMELVRRFRQEHPDELVAAEGEDEDADDEHDD
jgi:protein phosphatase inhibitor 2